MIVRASGVIGLTLGATLGIIARDNYTFSMS